MTTTHSLALSSSSRDDRLGVFVISDRILLLNSTKSTSETSFARFVVSHECIPELSAVANVYVHTPTAN